MAGDRSSQRRWVWLAASTLLALQFEATGVPAQQASAPGAVERGASSAVERPLPDAPAFLAQARKHLERDSSRQSGYSYVERRRELKLDDRNKPIGERVNMYESYPGLPGEDRWERLIEADGKPVPASELEARDRDRRKKVEAYARRLASQPKQVSAEQQRKYERASRESTVVLDDVFRVYDIRMLRREAIEGHDTIAFSLTPKPGAKALTREGSIMRHFAVRAWVSETDYELVRLEAEAIETVPFGLGLVARMHKGANLTFQRRKVNDEAWLPAMSSYAGSARVGLVKVIRRGGISEYSDYKKFTVGTAETFSK